MSDISEPQRIELSPAVRAILETDTPKSQLLRHFLRFTEAVLAPDPAMIDRVVTPDARFHELEAIGYPRGPEGFKAFRRQVNAAVPDEHIFIVAVRFEGDDVIEADLDIRATHTGEEFMGVRAAGRKIHFFLVSACLEPTPRLPRSPFVAHHTAKSGGKHGLFRGASRFSKPNAPMEKNRLSM